MSIANRGQITAAGLAADPKVFNGSYGSKPVHVTVYVGRPYRAANGTRPSDPIQLETFMHKGDKVEFRFNV